MNRVLSRLPLKEVRALMAENRPDRVFAYCRDIQRGVIKAPLAAELYYAALWACAKSVAPNRALALLDEMPKAGVPRDITAWNYYLEACAHRGEVVPIKFARQAIAQDKLALNQYSYQHVISAHVEAAQIDKARATMAEMEKEGMVATWPTFIRLIKAYLDQHRPQEAQELLSAMRGRNCEGVEPKYWADLTRGFALNNDVSSCLVCYDQFFEIYDRSGRSTLDYGFFSTLLESCARNARPVFASRVLRRMQQEMMSPNAHHLACLVSAFFLSKDYKAAFEVLRIMRGHDIEPAPYVRFGFLFSDIDELEVAFGLLLQLHQPDIEALNVLIRSCSHIQTYARGLEIYEHCQSLKLSPNLHTFNAALGCSLSDKQRAFQLLGDMRALGIQPNAETYEQMIKVECRNDMYENAFGYLAAAKNDKATTENMYFILIQRLLKSGDERWRELIEDMDKEGFHRDKRLQRAAFDYDKSLRSNGVGFYFPPRPARERQG
ncbi:hypothetical protein RI367_007528 [Sorochytrium milnesiophthora]